MKWLGKIEYVLFEFKDKLVRTLWVLYDANKDNCQIHNSKTFFRLLLCADEIQFEQLTEKLAAKQTELRLCVFLVEHCLYLLWAHLDYYMLHAVPVQTSYNHQFNQSRTPNQRQFTTHPITNALRFRSRAAISAAGAGGCDAAWKVTADDVAQLKKSLNQVLNETFSKQLLATASAAPNETAGVDRDFVAALLRRVKRLIQFAPGAAGGGQ